MPEYENYLKHVKMERKKKTCLKVVNVDTKN